jgi:21S rRNA (GM2251-2'-O)-methyltransferase
MFLCSISYSSYLPRTYEYLYSFSSVLLALRANKRHFKELYIRENHEETVIKKERTFYSEILTLATDKQIPITRISRDRLNRLAGNRPHQGVILRASPLLPIPLPHHSIPIDDDDSK